MKILCTLAGDTLAALLLFFGPGLAAWIYVTSWVIGVPATVWIWRQFSRNL